MNEKLLRHPCINPLAKHRYARAHLPVAPKCNVQCGFCNRKYDCVNESRPGVTSGILSPEEAVVYLGKILERRPETAVVGIAGPGDPFANPAETIGALRLVKERHPELSLCVATNGLNSSPYLDELAALETGSVTVTVNAVDPEIGGKVYAWVLVDGKAVRGTEGAAHLLAQQELTIRGLVKRGIMVKVNSVVIPGVNDRHIPEIAKTVASWGAEVMNAIPLQPSPDTQFSTVPEPSAALISGIREEAGKFLPQMAHCARCRADASGFIGEKQDPEAMRLLQQVSGSGVKPPAADGERIRAAVASSDGSKIDLRLGEASQFFIFEKNGSTVSLKGVRLAPQPSHQNRWENLAELLSDCAYTLCAGAGLAPLAELEGRGIQLVFAEGGVSERVRNILQGVETPPTASPHCPPGCSGGRKGCGGDD
jgi:nitrogen fixation protein NifB